MRRGAGGGGLSAPSAKRGIPLVYYLVRLCLVKTYCKVKLGHIVRLS